MNRSTRPDPRSYVVWGTNRRNDSFLQTLISGLQTRFYSSFGRKTTRQYQTLSKYQRDVERIQALKLKKLGFVFISTVLGLDHPLSIDRYTQNVRSYNGQRASTV